MFASIVRRLRRRPRPLHLKKRSVAPRNFMIFVAAVFGIALGAQAIAATTDATLSSLVPSVGVMTKASDNTSGFTSAQLTYRVAVPSGTTTFDLTPTATEGAATIDVSIANGAYASVANRTPTTSYSLTSGVNLFKVKVTAPDTTTIKIYEVRVVKELNDNNNMLQISFTGMTALPDKLALLGANHLEVAWTLGTDLTNATWKNIGDAGATSLVYIPRPDVLPTVNASDTWVMSVRADVNDAATRNNPKLYGFQGVSSQLGSAVYPVIGGAQYMKEVISLGQFANFTSLGAAFYGSTSQLVISCKLPATVTSLLSTFSQSTFNDPGISAWDVKAVRDLTNVFDTATTFNQDLSAWYVGTVVSLNSAFRGASAFNKPLDTWNISNVYTLASTFSFATAFNQPLNSWNTSKVTAMQEMFYGASAFNQPLNDWDTTLVTSMRNMFYQASAFNQQIGLWSTSNVQNMSGMFKDAYAFNQDIGLWNTSKVTTMKSMFSSTSTATPTVFNQNIGSWQTGAVTDMSYMFAGAQQFNQNLNSWNVSNVAAFEYMFNSVIPTVVGATSHFNNGASAGASTTMTWTTTSALTMQYMFSGASRFNQDISAWTVSKVTNMNSMFRYTSSFNQNLSSWQAIKVTDLAYFFQSATAFNNGLSAGASGSFTMATSSSLAFAWNVFDGASAFNQDISTWNTNGVTWATAFISSSTSSFNQSLAALNVGKYSGTTLTGDTTLVNFPTSMSSENVLLTLDAWANRDFKTANMSNKKFRIIFSGQQVPYNNCRTYDAYSKTLTWATYSGGASGTVTAPTGCGTAPSITWNPTQSPTNATVSNGVVRFTPDASPVASGYSGGLAYIVSNSTLGGNCTVSQSGEITFTIGGSSCDIKVYTTDPNYYIGSVTIPFSTEMAPGAPTITSWTQQSLQRINVNYTAGSNLGSAITKYQYSTDGGSTWVNELAGGSAPATILLQGQSVSYTAFVLGEKYNVKVRAFNTVPGAASNLQIMFVDTPPSAPTLVSVTPGDRQVAVAFNPGTNTGTAILKYQYSTNNGTDWVDASEITSPILASTDTATGLPLSNGSPYYVKIRAVNNRVGTASPNSSMVVPDAQPGAPTGVSITPGNAQLAVSFTRGTNTGSDITKYQYSLNGGETWLDKSGSNSTNSFSITGLSNGTTYAVKIRAFNTLAGEATASISAMPDIAHGAPSSLVLTAGPAKLTASFSAGLTNGGSAITKYQYSTTGGTTWADVAAISSPFDILTKSDDGLALVNGTTYQVKIRAFSTLAGAAIATAVAGTPNLAAPTQPRTVTGVSGAGAVEVSWLAPLSDGGATISGYTVTSTPGSYQCTTTGTLTCAVSGLTNGTGYTFRVTATNSVGTSSASVASASVIPATVPDAPTLSSAVIGNGTITVSWQAPASNGGSAITSYTVSTSAGGFTCVTSNLTCDLTGLTNGTNYTVKVKATNALGDSAFSGTLTRKPDVAPSAPIITSIVAGDRELKIYFTLPASNGGSAVSALLSTMNGGTSWSTTSTLTSPLTIQIQNEAGTPRLVNGTEYTVQLATANSIQSAWSTSQSATPNVLPGSPAGQPTAVAGASKATVSWMAASDNGGSAILGYTVTSNPGSLTCTTTGSTSCEVTGLTNGVAYTFTVFATNALGNGLASAATEAVKPDVAPGAPTNLTLERGDRTLAVSFTAGTNAGSAIVKYQYSFDGTTWSDFATNSSATTQTISGLTNGTLYTVYLRAVNTLTGTGSSSVSAIPRAAPGAPASFALTAGFKEISVSWATATGGSGTGVGTTGGTNITKYQYSLNGGTWIDFAGTSSPQVISGLQNAVSYSVKIRAYSDIPGVESSSLSASPIKNSQAPLELTVAESVTWISSPSRAATLTYTVGGSLTLQTTGGSGTGQVVYSLTNDSECSVVNTTLLIPDAGRPCKVTATKVSDGDYSSEDSPMVWIITSRAEQVPLVWKSQNALIFGQSFDVSYAGGSGNGAIVVASQNTAACAVSGIRVTAVGVGTCNILVEKQYSTNYNRAWVLKTVIVGAASQTVSFTSPVPSTPLAGDTYNVTATSTSGASPTFTIVSGSCSVSGGQVTFTSSGDCVIRASATRTNYSNASKTQTISVGQRNQTLSFASAIQSMTAKSYGSPAFFADASTTEATLTPSYALGSGTSNSACSVSTSGIVQLLAAGICEIEVSQAGSAAVAAASSISKTFTVLPDQASQPYITSVSAGHQSITAAFIKPSYSGGSPITAYRVDAVFAGGVESTSACAVDAGSTQTCTISGLTNGTSYQVKVAAITLAGAGIFSDLAAARVPATNPAAVSAFTAVPDNTTIALTWEDPISLGGGTFDSYRIFYKRSSVSSYPSSYINVQSQSPTNYTITGLINGESYDVKIVTVTTANTASLTSNTAEVKETPRTVPDAPATVDVLEVAGKVVITWSAPQSDGGNPVNEYRVTINGSACSLTNVLDNLCEITAPTSSGTYPIEVKAKNDAGYSSPATATFTKAGVPSSGGGSGGSATPGGTESAPNGAKAIQILSLSVKNLPSVGGQFVSVTGKNFTGVTTVLVGGIKAKIISVKDALIKFIAPRNSDGPATLTVKSSSASAEVIDAFVYTNGIAKAKVIWVLGFIQTHTAIKAADKAKLRSALQMTTGTVAVTCVGYQSYSYNTPRDAQTAIGRAKQACNYLKGINPKLSVKTFIARTNLRGTPSRKLAVQFRAIK